MVNSAYFVKSTPLRAFTGSFLCRYITDILKMCMKKFDAEIKSTISHFLVLSPPNVFQPVASRQTMYYLIFQGLLKTFMPCVYESFLPPAGMFQRHMVYM